jgi:hypothetical protein
MSTFFIDLIIILPIVFFFLTPKVQPIPKPVYSRLWAQGEEVRF